MYFRRFLSWMLDITFWTIPMFILLMAMDCTLKAVLVTYVFVAPLFSMIYALQGNSVPLIAKYVGLWPETPRNDGVQPPRPGI